MNTQDYRVVTGISGACLLFALGLLFLGRENQEMQAKLAAQERGAQLFNDLVRDAAVLSVRHAELRPLLASLGVQVNVQPPAAAQGGTR